MIGLERYKALLGSEAGDLNDDEIQEIRDAQYQIARVAFEMWRKERMLKKTATIAQDS
jgi:hypothetical protein